MKRFLIAGAGLLAVGFAAFAFFTQNSDLALAELDPYGAGGTPADFSTFFAEAQSRSGLPAVGGIVVTAQSFEGLGAFGRTSVSQTPRPIDDPVIHIGSLTKAMTAIVTARFVERGQLSWSSTLAELLPQYIEEMNQGWHAVELHQLMRMNGGVGDDNSAVMAVFEAQANSSDRTANPQAQRDDILSVLLSLPPTYQPGTRLQYSNFSYVLVGEILETLTGQPFEDVMAQELFVPLSLSTAGFGPLANGEQLTGHRRSGTTVANGPNADNPASLSAAGRIHMSLTDYGRYMQFIIQAANGNSSLISQETMNELLTPFEADQDYAMGWRITDEAGPNVVTLQHTGSNTLWYANAWITPEADIGVMAFTNQGDTDDEVDQILWRLVTATFENRAARE